MMRRKPFMQGRAFDDEATRVMGDAFDKARRMMRDKGQPRSFKNS
jgi:hypothetical protein